jgi:hypothetical protein
MIRDLTELEDRLLTKGFCPFCGTTEFLKGPAAALAQNIECKNPDCAARFNVLFPLRSQLIRESDLESLNLAIPKF